MGLVFWGGLVKGDCDCYCFIFGVWERVWCAFIVFMVLNHENDTGPGTARLYFFVGK